MWAYFPGLDLASKMPSPRTLKTHLPVQMLPPSFWKENSKVGRANSSNPVLISMAKKCLYLSGNNQWYWKITSGGIRQMVALTPHSHTLYSGSTFPSKYYFWVYTRKFSDKTILIGCQLSHIQREWAMKQSTNFLRKVIIFEFFKKQKPRQSKMWKGFI